MDCNHYASLTRPANEEIRVAVIGLGPGGLALAKSMAKVHPVCGFDYCWDGSPDPVENIWWSTNPNDLSSATHFIIADSYSRRYTGRELKVWVTDMLWARCIIRAALEGRKSPATIIMASVVPNVGRTRELFGNFHAEGHRLGVAPQLPLHVGVDDASNGLPKLVAGIDRESMRSVRSLYGSVFDRTEVFHVGTMEQAEVFTCQFAFTDVWVRALLRMDMEGIGERAAESYGDDEDSKDRWGFENPGDFDKVVYSKGSPNFDLSEDSDSSTRTA
ncbi:hypothetical protein PV04_10562 [Phialophora macrospora]|uniref:Uncharacterized protein n=1 Tax=Phialophora macrospora TaxID=1851006 RepID=A0A0D2DJ38_9EURO|nr:hypothetical protein PV04_10562 [Phialophora macrospora]